MTKTETMVQRDLETPSRGFVRRFTSRRFGPKISAVNIELSEPTTALTDFALAIACGYFAFRLMYLFSATSHRPLRLWGFGFIAVALASLIGGTFHGFATLLGETQLMSLWNILIFCAGMGGGFMIAAVFAETIRPTSRRGLWMLFGLAISLASFLLHQARLGFHASFNHNDLFHILQLAALYCLYRGAIRIPKQ